MASPQGAQSATLDQFLGLVTIASPDSIPEGSSPLCWDVDFDIGSVKTRPGLVSRYILVPISALLQEDGTSYFLLENGTGVILLES